mmetsp:Transcript_24553/g.77835  ORF Transcript_24553/g.77835 Transcript_24553/m.77835 type:complete len:263 (-) Transcript_24553:216-1004(-)
MACVSGRRWRRSSACHRRRPSRTPTRCSRAASRRPSPRRARRAITTSGCCHGACSAEGSSPESTGRARPPLPGAARASSLLAITCLAGTPATRGKRRCRRRTRTARLQRGRGSRRPSWRSSGVGRGPSSRRTAPSSSGARRSRSWRRTSRRSRCRRRRSPRRWSARSTRCTCDAAIRATAFDPVAMWQPLLQCGSQCCNVAAFDPENDGPRPDSRARITKAALAGGPAGGWLLIILYVPSNARGVRCGLRRALWVRGWVTHC